MSFCISAMRSSVLLRRSKTTSLMGRLSSLNRAASPANSQQRKCFGVGDELCAFVVRVDAFKQQVDFAIALGSEAPRNEIAASGSRAKVKMSAGSALCMGAISRLQPGIALYITSRFLRKIACFLYAFFGRMPTQSFLSRRLRKRGATVHERFTRDPKRQWQRGEVYYHSLERSAGGTW